MRSFLVPRHLKNFLPQFLGFLVVSSNILSLQYGHKINGRLIDNSSTEAN
uniref:Uncharacterized protein n=1 Tax=Arundo donax TaxID=35708 RepID=A0A0A8XZ61_ARUDO